MTTVEFPAGVDSVPVMGLHFMREPVTTAKSYVQDGIVANWDGIENVGLGVHDAAAETWKDLVGGRVLTLRNGSYFGNDRLVCPNVGAPAYSIDGITGVQTYEIGFMTDQTRGVVLYVTNSLYGYIYNNRYWCNGTGSGSKRPNITTLSNWISRDISLSFTSSTGNSIMDAAYRDGVDVTAAGGTDYWRAPRSSIFAIGGYYGSDQTPDEGGCIRGHVRYIRLYSRALTAAEVAANHAIDRERFNLP